MRPQKVQRRGFDGDASLPVMLLPQDCGILHINRLLGSVNTNNTTAAADTKRRGKHWQRRYLYAHKGRLRLKIHRKDVLCTCVYMAEARRGVWGNWLMRGASNDKGGQRTLHSHAPRIMNQRDQDSVLDNS